MTRLPGRLRRPVIAAAVVLGVALAGLGVRALLAGPRQYHVTAYFSQAIGIYKGSSVRILGVPVGTVTRVIPRGTQVQVDMVYAANDKLPADVGALLVPPSIVSDRYVALAPVYDSGAVLPDHAVLQLDHTAVPVELDQIFSSLNTLNVALGPKGANSRGALARLVDVGAANLNGNGALLNSTFHGFSTAISTLANSKDQLFGTISQLQQFTSALAADDPGVRRVNDDLAQVAAQLAGERQDLGLALANLATALGQVRGFVADNRTTLTHDVHTLTTVTSGLLTEEQAIKEVMDEAPLGLHNLAEAFDPPSLTLRTRTNLDPTLLFAPTSPTSLACTLLAPVDPTCGQASPATPSPLLTVAGVDLAGLLEAEAR